MTIAFPHLCLVRDWISRFLYSFFWGGAQKDGVQTWSFRTVKLVKLWSFVWLRQANGFPDWRYDVWRLNLSLRERGKVPEAKARLSP